MRLTTSCTPAAVPISVCTNRATVRPSGSGERAVVATEAPLRVKRRTIACPMPFVPPVTRTRLPLNSSPETGKGYVIVMIESPRSNLGAEKFEDVLLRAIAQPEVSQHTGEIGSTHEKVR